jgi:hypothetical protein
MAAQVQVEQVIDRPLAGVFHFMATEHVRNHPRWDPDIELEQITSGPIGVGTMIRRRNSRSGTPVDGTMEVIEYEPNRAFGVVIHDGPMEMRARIIFEAVSGQQTKLTTIVELPGMDKSADTSMLIKALERSGQNRKKLIEAEIE